MGSMGDLMKMMGIGGMLGMNSSQQAEIANQGENVFKQYETAYNSMTKEERIKPQIIDMSRRRRIAGGAGIKENELGKMLNQFEQMRGMFKQFSKMLGGFSLPGMGGGGNNLFGGSTDAATSGSGDLNSKLSKMTPQQMAKELGGLSKSSDKRSANIPGFPFSGPGGGYYRKKKK
jgi:signal recognition particle subunit SRP54